jgi:putative endonuclease
MRVTVQFRSRVLGLNLMLRLFYFMYVVYILYSNKFDRYYVGHCEDINNRLIRHNSKAVPSTKPYVPWELVYTEIFSSRTEAARREKEIKNKKSRKYIEFIVGKGDGTGRHVPM